MAGETVKCTRLDASAAFEALSALAGTNWADPKVAVRIGRNLRALRDAQRDIDQERQLLLDEFAVRDEDGGYKRDIDGSIRVKEQKAFHESWQETMNEEVELTVYPVDVGVLGDGKSRKGNCKECHRAVGPTLNPFHLEALVNIGVIIGVDEPEPAPAKPETAAE